MMFISCYLTFLLLLFLLSSLNVVCDLCQRPCGQGICHLRPRARLWERMWCVPLALALPSPTCWGGQLCQRATSRHLSKKLRKRHPQPVILSQVHCCPCLPLHWWITCLCDISTSERAKQARNHCSRVCSRTHEIRAANTCCFCYIYCPIWQIFWFGNTSIPSVVSDPVQQSSLTGLMILIPFLQKFLCRVYKYPG